MDLILQRHLFPLIFVHFRGVNISTELIFLFDLSHCTLNYYSI